MIDNRTSFQLVSDMNVAFGNPQGNPLKINAEKLLSQCKNIPKESQELFAAFGIKFVFAFDPVKDYPPGNPVHDIRDALCDHMVFILGAYHFMGYDADRDMREVVDAVMTRFCTSPEHLKFTEEHYTKLGVKYYVEGQFPRVCLKSSEDQGDGEYPKGKFLKALGYRKPSFYQVEALPSVEPKQVIEVLQPNVVQSQPGVYHPLTAQSVGSSKPPEIPRKFMGMPADTLPDDLTKAQTVTVKVDASAAMASIAEERAKAMRDQRATTAAINAQVQAYRDELERKVYGFEPFTDGDGQVNKLTPPVK